MSQSAPHLSLLLLVFIFAMPGCSKPARTPRAAPEELIAYGLKVMAIDNPDEPAKAISSGSTMRVCGRLRSENSTPPRGPVAVQSKKLSNTGKFIMLDSTVVQVMPDEDGIAEYSVELKVPKTAGIYFLSVHYGNSTVDEASFVVE